MCSGCDSWSDDTQLLDMTPATSTFDDATLVVGRSFTDTTYGFDYQRAGIDADSADVQVVKAGGGGNGDHARELVQSLDAGGELSPSPQTVTGNAPTGTVAFTDGGAAISGCGAVALTGTGNSRTAQCATAALSAATHSIVAAYGAMRQCKFDQPGAVAGRQQQGRHNHCTGQLAQSVDVRDSVTFTATVTGNAPTGTSPSPTAAPRSAAAAPLRSRVPQQSYRAVAPRLRLPPRRTASLLLTAAMQATPVRLARRFRRSSTSPRPLRARQFEEPLDGRCHGHLYRNCHRQLAHRRRRLHRRWRRNQRLRRRRDYGYRECTHCTVRHRRPHRRDAQHRRHVRREQQQRELFQRTLAQGVGKSATSTGLGSSLNPSTFGTSVTSPQPSRECADRHRRLHRRRRRDQRLRCRRPHR